MSSGEWSGEDEYECAVCEQVFESEDELEEHRQQEHSDEDIQ